MAKKTAVTSNAMTVWDAELARLAQEATAVVKNVGGGGNFLSIQGGVLSYQKAVIPGNKLNAIVIDHCLVNAYYDKPYDPQAAAAPACYALGRVASEMTPHENVEHPVNPTCKGCPNKEFGSADRGKGKACGDLLRLALITASDAGTDIIGAEVAHLSVPYFSTLEWTGYVRQLAELHHKPPLAFVTEISLVPDKKSQFRLKFHMVEPVENNDFEALITKYKTVSSELMFPFPKFDEQVAQPANGRKAAAPAKKRKF